MTLQRIVTLLRSSDATVRRDAWGQLWGLGLELPLGQRDLADLEEQALHEPDVEVLCRARAVVGSLRELNRPSLQDTLWVPFDAARARYHGIGGGAAVVSVSDEHQVPDAKSLIALAQYLPHSSEIEFPMLNLADPAGDRFHPGGLRALCLVARPSFYGGFIPAPCLPGDLRLRFPADDLQFRRKAPTPDSAKTFHRVQQWWEGRETGAFEARQHSGPGRNVSTRVDFAVVQRFPILFAGRLMTVVILAGSTSLGTAGAVHFATRERFDLKRLLERNRSLQPITDETRIEMLLEVHGTVHTPARPWAPYVQVKKLFLDQSPNLVSDGPSSIRLEGGRGGADKVRAIFFDDDGIRFDADDHASLIALCLKAAQSPERIVNLQELITDLYVWPGRRRPASWADETQAKNHFTYAFQRHCLKHRIHVVDKYFLHLDTEIVLA
jgi:hypothetical protein